MATARNRITRVSYNDLMTRVNSSRTRWGLTAFSQDVQSNSTKISASHFSNIRNKIIEGRTHSGCSTVASPVPAPTVGSPIQATLLTDFYNKATEVLNYCSCDCNRCSCDCDNCSCDCNRCSCTNTCSCDCDRCSCNGACSCNCDRSSSSCGRM